MQSNNRPSLPYQIGAPAAPSPNLPSQKKGERLMEMIAQEAASTHGTLFDENTTDPLRLHFIQMADVIRALSRLSGKSPQEIVPTIRTILQKPCKWSNDGKRPSCGEYIDAQSDPTVSHLVKHWRQGPSLRQGDRIQCRWFSRGRMCGIFVPGDNVHEHMFRHVQMLAATCKMCGFTAEMPFEIINHYSCGECRSMTRAIVALNPKHHFLKRLPDN